jgi:hypothetical protein
MQATPKFQKAVMALAAKHDVDLDRPGAYLRLEKEECGQLVIENIGGERISVTNYVQVRNDWVADPEIVVYIGRNRSTPTSEEGEPHWVPIEVNQFFGGWQLCAELDQRGDLVVYDLAAQFEMAQLAEGTVANMLIAQDWLNAGTRAIDAVRARTPEEIHARDIRLNEMDDVPF